MYQQLLQLNNAAYPLYISELKGMAQASFVPFDVLMLANLADNLHLFLPLFHRIPAEMVPAAFSGTYIPKYCADVWTINNPTSNGVIVAGHNEDED